MTLYALNGVSPELPDDGDYWVAPDANVIGNVILGSGVSVWFGATLRGDNEPINIGAGTNIQENTVIHTDPGFPATIGANCTIGHKAMLHGCTIGKGALIGMGATVLNGAVIGAGAIIGASALVPPGKVIPPMSLVMGVPGKVVRDVDQKAQAESLETAAHYQERMRFFRSSLTEVNPN